MNQQGASPSQPDRSQQLTQLWSIARSLSPVALGRLLRFAIDLETQSKGKSQTRSNRLNKPIDDSWQIGN